MLTIKIPYQSTGKQRISELQKQYSPILRFCYKRLREGMNQAEINTKIKQLFGLVDSWFVASCVSEAKGMVERDGEKIRIFGGKKNFEKRKAGKISSSDWKECRISPLSVIGEAGKKGNRKFKFDLENNKIVFKVSRKEHIDLTLPKLGKELRRKLKKLQKSCEQCLTPVSVRISENYLWISYNENALSEGMFDGKSDRVCALDLNPEYIGAVIIEGNQVVKSRLFNFKQLKEDGSNKLKHELSHVSKSLISFTKSHHCSQIAVEQLNIKAKNHNKGKRFNQLVNNRWNRNYILNQLVKRTNIEGIALNQINPAYSSIIGNLSYELPDAISAAIEIGRRSRRNAEFYPPVISKDILANRWKEAQGWSYGSWKDLSQCLKNSGVRYRISMSDVVFEPFLSDKSKVCVHDEIYEQRFV